MADNNNGLIDIKILLAHYLLKEKVSIKRKYRYLVVLDHIMYINKKKNK